MNKKYWYAVGLVGLILPVSALAAEFRIGEQSAIAPSEKITGDMYIAGGSVTSAGTVAGDLVVGGGTVVVSGDVGTDILAGGGNVTILSNVGDDLRVGGGNIVVQGSVGGDLVAGGGNVIVGGTGIKGDLVVGAGTLRLDAPVGGNIKYGGSNILINSTVDGNVDITADKVTLGSGAVINGNLKYKAKKELTMIDGAVVKGEVTYEPKVARDSGVRVAALVALLSLFVLGKFLALLASALVVGLVFRKYSRDLVEKAVTKPLAEIVRGIVTIIVLPVASVVIMMTAVGIPLGILGLITFGMLMLFAWMVAPIVLGSVVYRYFSKGEIDVTWQTILTGAFLYSVLGLIPLIGWFMQCVLMLLTIGVIVALEWQIYRDWR